MSYFGERLMGVIMTSENGARVKILGKAQRKNKV
jgi:hypothetical protein